MSADPETTARSRTVWTPSGWLSFVWHPEPDCPICHGEGMASQYRSYGDPQYHGEYFENCDRCSAPPKEDPFPS